MPGRRTPLVTGEYYHIYNRGVAHLPTFINAHAYKRAMKLIEYYQNVNVPMSYSKFVLLSHKSRLEILKNIRAKKEFLVDILCFCLMPNHFHFLVKQSVDNGISTFMSNFSNSYTRYLNARENRNGPLFQGKFKAVRIETDNQLLHVSRYIHLNPYTSYVVKEIRDLLEYKYSSLSLYIGDSNHTVVNTKFILSHFKSKLNYKKFVLDNADYQRNLDMIKHLLVELR